MKRLNEDLLKMGGLAEEAVDQASRSLITRTRADLARQVIRNDSRVNDMENGIDEQCIKLLATQQPVAVDLRFLTAALRISAILERTGDEAVNIAERALVIHELNPMDEIPPTLMEMSVLAQEMTRKSLDAFVRKDVSLAYDVCCQDDELDDLNRRLLEEMIRWMMDEHRLIRRGVELILAGRHFERIGDQATNIAEAVVFLVEGLEIRHQGGEICQDAIKERTSSGNSNQK